MILLVGVQGHDLVIDKAHLIREGKIPDCLLEYIARVTGYEATIKKWEDKDFSEIIFSTT